MADPPSDRRSHAADIIVGGLGHGGPRYDYHSTTMQMPMPVGAEIGEPALRLRPRSYSDRR